MASPRPREGPRRSLQEERERNQERASEESEARYVQRGPASDRD
jgi:hypothetical protein